MAVKEHILKDCIQFEYITKIAEIQEEHQQVIQDHDHQIQTIQYKNFALQVQDVYQTKLQSSLVSCKQFCHGRVRVRLECQKLYLDPHLL